MSFGQVVIGPPGSGKTTYCDGMQQFMTAIGRKVAVINLDPANDALPYHAHSQSSVMSLTFLTYKCSVNVSDLVRLDAVMEEHGLGPNGALLYCIEYLEKNIDWLREQLRPFEEQGHYLIFDCPGQVELYTHHKSMQNIVATFQKWNYRVTAVHLIDSFHCTTAANYISVVLLSLSTMMHLELPHVNVLSKIDMIERYGKLNFSLEFYTEVQDLSYLQRTLDRNLDKNFRRLNKALCELIEDYALVSFVPLNIQNKESVMHVLRVVDKSSGYIYGGLTSGNESIMSVAARDWVFTSMPDLEEQLKLSAFNSSVRDEIEDPASASDEPQSGDESDA